MRVLLRHDPSISNRRSRTIGARTLSALILAIGVAASLSQVTTAHWRTRHHRDNDQVEEKEKPLPIIHIVQPDPALQASVVPPPVGGSWTQLTNLPSVALDNCLLLTDGTVFCHQNGARNWYRLTPTNTGSYASGTWSLDSSMQSGFAPLYFASAVLPDGRVIVEGGEYNCNPSCSSNWGTQGSIYDPATHTWTAVSPPVGWTSIGDAQSVVLADGTFMLADCCSAKSAFFNAVSRTWTAVAGAQIDNYNDEEGWIVLPDRRVLAVDAWPSGSLLSEIFDPVTQLWTGAGNTPVRLTDNVGSSPSYEQGPGVLRPDGTVFYFGANAAGAGHTAIYNSITTTWSSGPDFPNGDGAADAPAALLPNGNVLVQGSPGVFNTPSRWYEVDKATSTFAQVASPSYSFSISSYYGQMLVLPTGQILQTEFSNDIRLYTPSGTYDPSWRPTITNVPSVLAAGQTYTISGTQFNGLSQAGVYGDDWQSATNYPLVRITNTGTGHVFYAKTHNHSTMAVATGAAIVSTSFDVPAGIESGAGSIEVVANGIPSATTAVTVQGAALPGAFSKTSPNNGATGQVKTPTLSWGASNGAASYEYCVNTVSGSCASWTSVGAATSAGPLSLAASTTYYWQVRARNGTGTTDANASTWWSFTTAAGTLPGAFNKTSPSNGATGQSTSVTLRWGTSSGATSYEYCLNTVNTGTCAAWTSVGTSRSVLKSGLARRTTYYWEVRARNGAGTTNANAGTWWSFRTR